MKKVFTSFFLALITTWSFAQMLTPANLGNAPAQKMQKLNLKEAPKSNAQKNLQATLWSDDFSVPANWTMTNDAGNSDNWVINAIGPVGGYSIGPITSTTAANGFALFDSDVMCSGDQIGHITTASPIDCSSMSFINLEFQSYYYEWYSDCFVSVSTDGSTWTDYELYAAFASNDGSANPEYETINITSVAAGQSTVWIRFTFSSPSITYAGNAGCGYSWMVDDVQLVGYDNELNGLHAFAETGYGFYSMMPATQISPIYFMEAVSNNGGQAQTNVALTVDVSDPINGSVYNQASTPIASFASGLQDTIVIPIPFTATDTADYEITYQINQAEVDENTFNNFDTLLFRVDSSTYLRAQDINYFSNPSEDGHMYGVTYHFPNNGSVNSGIFYLYQADAGTSVRLMAYKLSPNGIIEVVDSSNYFIFDVANAIPAATFQGVQLDFNIPVNVVADSNYIFGLEFVLNGGVIQPLLCNDAIQADNDWAAISFKPASGWATEALIPFLGLEVGAPVITGCINPIVSSVGVDNDINCFGDNDGAATVIATGGDAALSYSWDAGAQTGATASNLTPGWHYVDITDGLFCDATDSVEIAEPAELIAIASVISDISCFGENDGAAEVTATGGTFGMGGYSYDWSDLQTTSTATNLTPGLNSVTVTDDNGCQSGDQVDIAEPDELIAIASVISDISCFGDDNGIADVTATGGTFGMGGYSYDWSDLQITMTASNLTPGLHSVTVTDDNGCQSGDQVVIIEPALLTAVANVVSDISCFGYYDGIATVVGAGGTSALGYMYDWDSFAQTSDTAIDLTSGMHYVMVTDDNDCFAEDSVFINEPFGMVLDMTVNKDITCFGDDNGEASVAPSMASGPFLFDWSDGQTTPTAVGLTPGLHYVDVTDSVGCVSIATVEIFEPAELTIDVMVDNDITCNGDNDGMATATGMGGSGAYSYDWDGGYAATDSAFGLTPGWHYIDVMDDSLCIAFDSVEIIEPDSITVTGFTSPETPATNDGMINIFPAGGTVAVDYSYAWDDLAASTTQNITGLPAGTYYVTITDDNFCSLVDSFFVDSTLCTLTASIAVDTNASCFGFDDGSATVTPVGVGPTYTYLWNDVLAQTDSTASGLVADTFMVIVGDDGDPGCEVIRFIEITEPDDIVLNTMIDNDITCFGDDDGSASVNPTGGTALVDYSYDWDGTQITAIAYDLTPGWHYVAVTDDNGCADDDSVEIMEPAILVANAAVDFDITCFGDDDGSASVNPTGGTALVDYSYDWDGTQFSATATDLTPGWHYVAITDDNGCADDDSVEIMEPVALSLVMSSTDDIAYAGNGTATVVVSGGTILTDYSYLWDDSLVQTTDTATDLSAGLYSVIVTDDNGCTATDTVTVQYAVSVAGIDNTVEISIFPNPTTDYLNINVTGQIGDVQVAFIGMDGKTVFVENMKENELNEKSINVSEFANGTYILSITGQGFAHQQRVIVK